MCIELKFIILFDLKLNYLSKHKIIDRIPNNPTLNNDSNFSNTYHFNDYTLWTNVKVFALVTHWGAIITQAKFVLILL